MVGVMRRNLITLIAFLAVGTSGGLIEISHAVLLAAS